MHKTSKNPPSYRGSLFLINPEVISTSKLARRAGHMLAAALAKFANGDWGESSMSAASDDAVKSRKGQVHGLYGDLAVSGMIRNLGTDLSFDKIEVSTVAEVKAAPREYRAEPAPV